MNLRLLIDGIVRQTTVLVAQLSTTAGVRAPLARVADEVFHSLATEIEAQGVGRKVVADMFGMALRAYQKKLQRIRAGETDSDRTLWQSMIEFLQDGSKTRARIFQRFQNDGDREVGAVLNDLVTSGLVYSTGRGDDMRYGLTSEADLVALSASADESSLSHVIWLTVFSKHASTEEELAERLRARPELIAAAVARLVEEARVTRHDGTLMATNVVIPVGATEGWEAAVLDHFRAVTTTIAHKVSTRDRAACGEQVGGTTLSFSVYEGHPHEDRVKSLLSTVRKELHALWNEVSAYNAANAVPSGTPRVLFYFGQTITAGDEGRTDEEGG